MGLSRLSKQCQACPCVTTCTHKKMEAVAYMEQLKPNEELIVPLETFKGIMYVANSMIPENLKSIVEDAIEEDKKRTMKAKGYM